MRRDPTIPARARWRPVASAVLALAVSLSGCDPRDWFVYSLGLCGDALDDVAPSTPTGLAAVGGDHRVSLSWTANPDPDVDKYEISRSTTRSGPYVAR